VSLRGRVGLAGAMFVKLLLALGACADAAEPGVVATTVAASSGPGTTSAVDETTAVAPPRMPAPLVDNTAWAPVAAADDPLVDHRPARVECGVAGAYVEDGLYEVDTNACNYLARAQPSLVALQAGDRLVIAAYHDTLVSEEAGQAHLALLLGPYAAWQKFVPIPASPGIVDATPWQDEVVIDFDVPAGTPVGLHLHNHGYNTWTLLEVEARPAEAP
jgi:hypothetical protein